jgi:hypothetical protein
MLNLESRELRKQAQNLKSRHTELVAVSNRHERVHAVRRRLGEPDQVVRSQPISTIVLTQSDGKYDLHAWTFATARML